MDGAAFGYFRRRLQNISNRFSNPNESTPRAFSRGALKVKATLACGLNFYVLRTWDNVRLVIIEGNPYN